MAHVESETGVQGSASVATISPFAGGLQSLAEYEAGHQEAPAPSWLSSPFAEGFTTADGAHEEEAAAAALAAELEDEEFEEAVQALVDEVAGRHLRSTAEWSSELEAPSLAAAEAEGWVAGVASEADRLLEHLEHRFAERSVESLLEGEVEAAVDEALAEHGGSGFVSEQFIGGIVKKVRKVAKAVRSVVGRGLAAVGKLLPLGRVFALLRQLVPKLLRRVLGFALNRLPADVRPLAAELARKLGLPVPAAEHEAEGEGEDPVARLVSSFDQELSQAVLGGNEAAVHQTLDEAGYESAAQGEDRIAALDAARASLAAALTEAAPGTAPTAEVQQFIPAVMAAMPLIKAGLGVIGGRKKLVGFVAARLAEFIRPHVGPEGTAKLSRAIADTGLRAIGLEAEAPGTLGAEALVSMLEDTVRAVGELPAESLAEPLRLDAELQEAFREAASAYVPAALLRGGIEEHELNGEAPGVWVLMPRATGRCYRYRKYSRPCPVTLTRALARAVVLRGGDTLERRLLDSGVRTWPINAQIHLYETLPGAHLGHLAAFESEAAEASRTEEFEELTPEAAALLVREPGLGRRTVPPRRPSGPARLGSRLYTVGVPGLELGKPNRRFVVRLDVTGPKPVLRVHLRLSEREAYELSGKLARRALVPVVADMRSSIDDLARRSLATRLVKHSRRTLGTPLSADRAASLATAAGERMIAAVAAELPGLAPSIAEAVRDPAQGVTFTFAFTFADRATIGSGAPPVPTVAVRPGPHRD